MAHDTTFHCAVNATAGAVLAPQRTNFIYGQRINDTTKIDNRDPVNPAAVQDPAVQYM